MKNKLLLVSFPVDLGNSTFEKRLIEMFKDSIDLKVYRFDTKPRKKYSNPHIHYVAIILERFIRSYELQKEVRKAQNEGRKVLFHGVSSALFAYPATINNSSFIFTDWTRKLYEPIQKIKLSPFWQTLIHRKILNSQKYIMGITDAVIEEIAEDYHISKNKLKKVKLPFSFDLDLFVPSCNRNDNEVRLLFVGGAYYRKGGDKLLRWFTENNNQNLRMTMVTNESIKSTPNVTFKANVQYGQQEHINIFSNHDIFVLPTNCDSYPAVLGEAACSGLAILTTKNALGAPEIIKNGINGYICDSQEELFEKLSELVKNKLQIETMKQESRKFMETNFEAKTILDKYINYIFE